MIIFFDINVVLDVYLERAASAGSKHMLKVTVGADCAIFVAWHTAATAYYIFHARSKLPDAECRGHLTDLISWAGVVPSGTPELEHALSLEMRDFEDAMQIAAAVQCGAMSS